MYVVCLLFYAIGGVFVCFCVCFSPFPEYSKAPPGEETIILSFQNMFALHIFQHGHLLDGNLVEFLEAFALRHAFMYKDRIQVLHVAQTNQLVNRCVVAYITFVLRVGVTPFFGGHSE